MKAFVLSLIALFMKKPVMESHVLRNKEISSSHQSIDWSSREKAEQRERFEDAFEHYVKSCDFLKEFNEGKYTCFKEETLKDFVRQYTDEALRYLPDEFIQEIEIIKLQIQAK